MSRTGEQAKASGQRNDRVQRTGDVTTTQAVNSKKSSAEARRSKPLRMMLLPEDDHVLLPEVCRVVAAACKTTQLKTKHAR